MAVTALAVGILAAAALLPRRSDGVRLDAPVVTPAGAAGATPTAVPVAGWRQLPSPPLSPREGAAAAWVAGRVVVVGGSGSAPCPPGASCVPPPEPPLRDGAAYDPATQTWQPIAPAPVAVFASSSAVVDDVLYLRTTPRGFAGAEEPAPTAFLAYHSGEDRWEQIPAPSSDGYFRLTAAGDELIAYETGQERGAVGDWRYVPSAGRWDALPPDPLAPAFGRALVWTSNELVLLGIPASADLTAEDPPTYRAAALDLQTGTWRFVSDSDVTVDGSEWYWTGAAIVNPPPGSVAGDEADGAREPYRYGGALDPVTGRWSQLPPPPDLVYPDLYVSAGGPETVFNSDGAALHVPTGRWELLGVRDDLPTEGAATAWTGTSLVVVGGALHDEDDSRLVAEAFAWTPSWHAAGTPSAPTTAPSDVAVVRCGPDRAELLTPVVAAGPAGVRVRFEHPPAAGTSDLGYSVSWQNVATGGAGTGGDADGVTEQVLPLAPGVGSEVACAPPDAADFGDQRWKVRPEVVDPTGAWVNDELTGCTTASGTSAYGSAVPRSEAASTARAILSRQVDGEITPDEVVQLGYPDAPEPVYGVVRGGHTIARLRFTQGEGERVVANALVWCSP